MKILVINSGSSSLKSQLYELTSCNTETVKPLWEAHIEWKNSIKNYSLKINNHRGETYTENMDHPEHPLPYLMQLIIQDKTAVLTSIDEIDVIGHRIVHGGSEYQHSVLIDAKVKAKIRSLCDLAPLHNLAGLKGIEIIETLFKNKPQIAVFDTAFHHTLPEAASIYPGPYKWYEEGIRRYGFHGISFQYCSRRAEELLNTKRDPLKIVACHLGSGASLCAIKNGKSIDTTMGFTPLDGLMMDTRSGSIDPGILLYLLEKRNLSPEALSKELYEKSGLLGLSGHSGDMRDVLELSSQRDKKAILAIEVYIHRLSTMIGSMAVSLNGMNTLIFTAGIGENSPLIRQYACRALSFLGIQLDEKKNEIISVEDRALSTQDSKVKILLIHTREEFEIARECWKITRGKYAGRA